MKKMLVAMSALALVAQAVSAADVYSSNIVGYTKVSLQAGWNLLGTSWQGVGQDAEVTLGDLFDPSGLTSYSEDGSTPGDRINTWNLASGDWGTTYYYVNQPSWNYDDVDYTNTWMDPDLTPADPLLDSGNGYWLILTSAEDISTKGEVPSADQTLTLKAGWNLVANPFPFTRDWESGDISGTGLTSYSEDGSTPGDRINTWSLATGDWSTTYYYVNQPSWNYDDVDYTNTWMNPDLEPINLTFSANEGFWYIAVANGVQVTFESTP